MELEEKDWWLIEALLSLGGQGRNSDIMRRLQEPRWGEFGEPARDRRMAPGTLRQHLRALDRIGVVVREKQEGRHPVYRLPWEVHWRVARRIQGQEELRALRGLGRRWTDEERRRYERARWWEEARRLPLAAFLEALSRVPIQSSIDPKTVKAEGNVGISPEKGHAD